MDKGRLIRDEESTEAVVTEIIVIADRSGSMHSIVDDAVGGFNQFIDDQKAIDGEAFLTLVRFDDQYEVVCESTPIKEMKHITKETIKPRGNTALLDAIGRSINDTMPRMKSNKVIAVIITDGRENDSNQYDLDDIKKLVEQCTEAGWEFLFLGANIDSFAVGSSFGLSKGQTVDYAATSRGINTAYSNVSDTVHDFRSRS
jgi:Mg-chelatase subunit ChlD